MQIKHSNHLESVIFCHKWEALLKYMEKLNIFKKKFLELSISVLNIASTQANGKFSPYRKI